MESTLWDLAVWAVMRTPGAWNKRDLELLRSNLGPRNYLSLLTNRAPAPPAPLVEKHNDRASNPSAWFPRSRLSHPGAAEHSDRETRRKPQAPTKHPAHTTPTCIPATERPALPAPLEGKQHERQKPYLEIARLEGWRWGI